MVNRYYILENEVPKAVDLWTWDKWCSAHPNRDVKRSTIEGTDIRVVTVFFPLPYVDFDEEGREFLQFYGTMIFGGAMDQHEEKYVSREAAEDGHERLLARAKAVLEDRIDPPRCCKKSNSK